ncbi:MAG: hypothetical protein HFI32_02835 [Lachnospiraceae bacterium]|nr:hypothetical protein [Lachnospiraceae bacterium]
MQEIRGILVIHCKVKYACTFAFVGVLMVIFGIYVFGFLGSEPKADISKSGLENYFNNEIVCRENWIDLYGLEQNILGKRQIENFTIFKTDYVKMVSARETLTAKESEEKFAELYSIIEYLETCNIPYYYITSLLPIQDINDLPAGVSEGSHANQNRVEEQLKEFHVNTISIQSMDQICSIQKEELFYRTDHHWNLETCFAAYEGIIKKIQNDYNWQLDINKTTELENYDELRKEDSFLGSYGIKVGRFYAGKDDFVVYIPKFDTDFVFRSYDAKGELLLEKTGNFYHALLDDNMIRDMDYWNKYNAFCSMGYIENQVINNNAPNDLKCLYISHSYGRPMTMYLALNFKEIVNLDPQEDRFSGNYPTYIDDFQPDIVLFQVESEGMIIGEYETSD